MKVDTTKILATSKFGLTLGLYEGKYYIKFTPTSGWQEVPVEKLDEAVLYFNTKCDEASRGELNF